MYEKVLYFLNEDVNTPVVLKEGVIDYIKKLIDKVSFKIKYSKRFKELVSEINNYIKQNPNATDKQLSTFAAKRVELFVGYFSFDSLYSLATVVKNANEESIEELKTDEILVRLTALVLQSVKRLSDKNVNEKEALILTKIAEYASIPWQYTRDKFGTAIEWAKDGYALYENEEDITDEL